MTAAKVYKLGSKSNLSQEKSVNSRTFVLWELCPTEYGNISCMAWYKGKREAERQPSGVTSEKYIWRAVSKKTSCHGFSRGKRMVEKGT